MSNKETNTGLEEIFKTSLQEAKMKARAAYGKDTKEEGEEEEGEEEEEDGEKSHGKDKNKNIDGEESGEEEEKVRTKKVNKEKAGQMKGKVDEETLAAASLHPAARSVPDPKALTKSKIGMMQHMLGAMNGMSKSSLIDFFNKSMADFGPNKNWGIGDVAGKNASSIDMQSSDAVSSKGPKTKYAMPKLNVREDVEEMFDGQDLSEEFKDKASTLFEAAISARLIAETARLEEEYSAMIAEEITTFQEELTDKLDTYLDYVVENWMRENEVAIESALRNELMEEFMEGLKGLFAEHYIDVPQSKIDILESLAEKVSILENKYDEVISENVELKSHLLESQKEEILESIASDLALTQQEKFAALAEGIDFDGNLEVYSKKLNIIKENYFKTETSTYSSNITEETFEGEVTTNVAGNPVINRYAAAIARTAKK